MAHYALGKPGFVNFRVLRDVRDKALKAAQDCDCALIIGAHIPSNEEDDSTLWRILSELKQRPGRVVYIAGKLSEADAHRAEQDFGFKTVRENWEVLLGEVVDAV